MLSTFPPHAKGIIQLSGPDRISARVPSEEESLGFLFAATAPADTDSLSSLVMVMAGRAAFSTFSCSSNRPHRAVTALW